MGRREMVSVEGSFIVTLIGFWFSSMVLFAVLYLCWAVVRWWIS